MKAFQIKIMMKKTHPPVWSRCVIPGGITFSELAVLLNEITGWIGQSSFLFEFYHRGLRVKEKNADGELKVTAWNYDAQDAAVCYIDECLEQEEWFSYTFENGFSCRVTIEKVMDQCSFTYAQIIKSRGRFPAWTEDGSQEPLTENQAPSVSKEINSGEIKTEEVHMEAVNTALREKYRVYYGDKISKIHTETYEEICARISMGIVGLPGLYHPDNSAVEVKKCSKTLLGEFADLFKNAYMNEGERPKTKNTALLESALKFYTTEELKDYAKKLNLSVPSSMSKQELKERVADALLEPEVVEQRMSLLTDEEMELFETILQDNSYYYYGETSSESLDRLGDLDFLVFFEGNLAAVPADLAKVYEQINTPQFQEKRRMTVWLLKCLNIVDRWYGSAPMTVLRKLYHKNQEKPMKEADDEKIRELFGQIPGYENPCCLQGDMVISEEYFYEGLYLRLQKLQGDKKFYIPSMEEVEMYEKEGYPSDAPAYQELKTLLEKSMGIQPDESQELVQQVNDDFCAGLLLQNVMSRLLESASVSPGKKVIEKLSDVLKDVNNSTRMIIHRGHTPDEIFAQRSRQMEWEKESMGKEFAADTNRSYPFSMGGMNSVNRVMQEQTAAAKKIYPNDPCPCGSGKKYKKCCGRGKR